MAAVGRGGKLMASAGSRAGRLRALRGVIFDMDGCGSLANASPPPPPPPPPLKAPDSNFAPGVS